MTGYLVMFMQAGFAIVETGLFRAKNANHTMMMNFMVYGWGSSLTGYGIRASRRADARRSPTWAALSPLNCRIRAQLIRQALGAVRMKGFFLSGATYDVGVMVMFLFQMVFMDTATTIVTGAAAERWKYSAFSSPPSSWARSLIRSTATGHGAADGLSQLGANFGLGHGYCDFAGSGVVHAVGGITALAVSMIIGPRIGKYNRDGQAQPDAWPRHGDGPDRVLHPGLRLVRIQSGQHAGRVGQRLSAHRLDRGQHDAGRHAPVRFAALLYMWIRYGKPDASMAGNGLLAGLVAITAPSGFVNTVGAAIIGLVGRNARLLSASNSSTAC